MTREKLEQWLDKQVELYHEIKANQYLLDDDGNEFCHEYSNGNTEQLGLINVVKVAEIIGVPVKCEPFNCEDSEWKFKLTITYKGVQFYTLSVEEVLINE